MLKLGTINLINTITFLLMLQHNCSQNYPPVLVREADTL